MSTASGKGQVVTLIAVVFLFITVLVLAMLQFGTLITGGNVVDQTITAQFSYQMGDTRRMSGLQAAMTDYVWRAPSVNQDKYGDTRAYELSSLYFSANGSEVRLHDESFSHEEVRSDLKEYFSYKMNQTWLSQAAYPVDYQLVAGPRRADNFTVAVKDKHPRQTMQIVSLPIALQDGNATKITLATRTDLPIFEVENL